jgi:molybdopterin molybdotransferase
MREVVTEEEGGAVFRAPVEQWTAVNRAGEEIEPGRLLVAAGTRLRAPSLGLLAAMGFSAAEVHARPGVAVITTGDELLAPGQPRGHGQIYDSIAPMLSAALGVWGAGEVTLRRCRDNVETLHTEIETVLDCLDIVLVVGGVSVGDYDFTLPALERAGVKKIFHGVAQKPGKPLYFGKTPDGRLAFGLPGNPASALVCGAVYVRRAMELMAGVSRPEPRIVWAVAGEELTNRTGRTQFVRVETAVRGDGVLECRSAGGQGSYMLSSFAVSDCLAELPPGPVTVSHGEPVALYPLGWD